ncbi:glycosyltransferase family protein [Dysgonomonas macrotermitis]|uniref:Uncharacterized protein n=1 Tax=Dysgonomonas macrotermitis TaxID=1346286 RepID=A0A1M5CA00_9BACT|nr:hypothetical protein [Dysgonomonas macrotermitis]SHF51569.1 hypothetical protein SAMN05444362_10789 [Dysgonomonas macrotermitis]
MKILLLGEYSGLHLTLAEGLKYLGHQVTVASDGDGFKNYYRDIDLLRKSSGLWDTAVGLKRIIANLPKFKGYDIVQIINPCFTTQNIEVNLKLYRYLKRHNYKVFLGAFGDDYYWLKACLDKKFRYSEFNIGDHENNLSYNQKIRHDWLETKRKDANIEIAETCNGIIACLYEYFEAYKDQYNDKLAYIPLPVNTKKIISRPIPITDQINFFIGINKARSEFKGTDMLYRALTSLQKNYPDDVRILKAESVDYSEYLRLISDAHVVLDQIYSYSPAMNGLLTMALGKVLVGGGEPEMYSLSGEDSNRPVINVYPAEESIYHSLESVIRQKFDLPTYGLDSRRFVDTHHNYIKVAQQYLDFWGSK